MTIAFVQSTSGISTGTPTSFAKAYGSNNTAGNLLIAVGTVPDAGGGVPTLTDSQGNTWTVANGLDGGSGKNQFVGYVQNCKGGANTVTANQGGVAVTGWDLAIYEFSGAALTGGPDHTATSLRYATTTTPTTTAFTASQNGALYFGVLAIDAAATITKNAAYTQGETPTALRNDEYLIQSVAASLAASWTVSVTTRGTWYIYVFLPAAGGGATMTSPLQLSDQLNRIVQGS